ncbi:unnamed protein product [Parnassius apollo]|uniref:(apollo) hypothetical protein n=1 Tax=Parnassius apollo TaxID=110799 RepID=A0A8S3W6T0_PARAO|nr:unnamed protein product [Parnassius apollo]
MEQFARSSNIEIQCLPENKEENILNTVVQIGKVINCNINEIDISQYIRISKLNPQSTRTRSVLVRFNNQRIRDSFIASASKYNKEGKSKLNTSVLGIACDPPKTIFVAEYLRANDKELYAAARARAKELGFRFVWVKNEKIFVRKT